MTTRAHLFTTLINRINTISNTTIRTILLVFTYFVTTTAAIFAGAMVFSFLGALAPGFRESLPNFYQLIDAIVGTFDMMVYDILHPWFLR